MKHTIPLSVFVESNQAHTHHIVTTLCTSFLVDMSLVLRASHPRVLRPKSLFLKSHFVPDEPGLMLYNMDNHSQNRWDLGGSS